MSAAILAVGDELLIGQILDTNSAWIAEQLGDLSITCGEHRQVGDSVDAIASAVRELSARHDLLVVCGGLGPTDDDCTREGVARGLDLTLERSAQVVVSLEERFAARGIDMPPSNLRQADLPDGAHVLENPNGTAPGFAVRGGACSVFVVPGPPYEMRPMVTNHVVPQLLDHHAGSTEVTRPWKRIYKTWGLAEATIGERVSSALSEACGDEYVGHDCGAVRVGYLARGADGIWIKLAADRDDLGARAAAAVERVIGPAIYGTDGDTLESVVLDLCRERGWSLATAESLTAGMVSSRLAAVPGASDVFVGGVVTYATELKRALLGVTAEFAVSGECAAQMAAGVAERLGADVAISTTGVAGPDTLEGQPPGTVFVGVHLPGEGTIAAELRLPGDRERVREYTVISALDLLRRRILESNMRSI
ncbi:MAG: CinA family nicotinamide mononucleotide deamidase-related protein [Acidimicrobiia bacterium]